jgi:phospholipid transport system substrate-binding protein
MRLIQPRWLAAAAAALSMFATSVAAADPGAEAFVTERANEVLTILGDANMPLEDKKARFRSIVDDVADVPAITRFVLGRYARQISDSDMASFATVFKEYAIRTYEARLGDYAGQTLVVTGSTELKPGDTVVHTEVTGGGEGDPLPVNWRVLTRDDGFKVVDVEVFGVWLAINQRDEITSIINNNRGSIEAATQALRQKIDQGDFADG